MKDINGEVFYEGDKLKVVKEVGSSDGFSAGDIVVCTFDDGTRICEFKNLNNGKEGYFFNDNLQKL